MTSLSPDQSLQLHHDFHAHFARMLSTGENGRDNGLHEAFLAVRREDFCGDPPWIVTTHRGGTTAIGADHPFLLYQNVLISICSTRKLNSGAPSLHAHLLASAEVKKGDRVIHVGTGLGYYTAILSHLTGAKGSVVGYEIEPDLVAAAATNLSGYSNVELRAESALAASVPQADVIYVCAGVTHPPKAWLDALRPGGRLVFPLTSDSTWGIVLMIRRVGEDEYEAHVLTRAAFVPCKGARSDTAAVARLERALAAHTGPWPALWFRRSSHPDDTCWLEGDGWWLSMRPLPEGTLGAGATIGRVAV